MKKYKITIFCFLISVIFSPCISYGIEKPSQDNEYSVYSDTLLQLGEGKSGIGKDILVIRKETITRNNNKSDKWTDILKRDFGEMADDTLIKEFVTVNSKSSDMQDKFDKRLNIILLSKESYDRIFNPIDKGWKRFYSEYPNSSRIIELSRIAFNADTTKALLYYGCSFDSGKGGVGYYILVKKEKGNWIIQKKVMCWIA